MLIEPPIFTQKYYVHVSKEIIYKGRLNKMLNTLNLILLDGKKIKRPLPYFIAICYCCLHIQNMFNKAYTKIAETFQKFIDSEIRTTEHTIKD